MNKRQAYCNDCRATGPSRREPWTIANGLITFALLWVLIIPGIAYAAWVRYKKSQPTCGQCGSRNISVDTEIDRSDVVAMVGLAVVVAYFVWQALSGQPG